jgi:hypothetical protein
MTKDAHIPESIKRKLISSPDLLTRHLQQPDISVDTHLRIRRREIGERALSRRLIYLDQRFWIECRDAKIGSPNASLSTKEIWHQLKVAVDSGRIWCPVFASVYCETKKQAPHLRIETARVIDRLSGGISIRHSEQRVMIEFSHWVWTTLLGDQTLAHPHSYAWTSIGSILGEAVPYEAGFDNDMELATQKSWIDLQNTLSLEDYFQSFNEQGVPPSNDNDSAFQLFQTHMSRRTKPYHNTFGDVFDIELRGLLELIDDKICALAKDIYSQGRFVTLNEQSQINCKTLSANLVALALSGLKMNRVDTELPFLHISANIYALARHIGQPFKKGDTHDFQHAAAALPYCEAFFTEKRMANLLKREPSCLDKVYECTVLNKRDAIIEYLKTINI